MYHLSTTVSMRKSRLLFMHTHTSRYSPLPSAHNMMWRQKHSEFSRLHHYPSNSFFLYYWRERERKRERERDEAGTKGSEQIPSPPKFVGWKCGGSYVAVETLTVQQHHRPSNSFFLHYWRERERELK